MFFFEVFEDLKVEDRLKKIFENISVTNITSSDAHARMDVYVDSNKFIKADDRRKMEEHLFKQFFEPDNKNVNLHIRHKFEDMSFPDIWKKYGIYVEDEFTNTSGLLESIYRNSVISVNENELNIELDDNFINHEIEKRLSEIITRFLDDYFGLKVTLSFTYKAEEKSDDSENEHDDYLVAMDNYISSKSVHSASESGETASESVDAEAGKEKADGKESKGDSKESKSSDKKGKEGFDKSKFVKKKLTPKDPDVIYGTTVEGDVVAIKDIIDNMGDVVIKGMVLRVYDLITTKGGFFLFKFSLTDFTDTILCKFFLRTEEDKELITSNIKEGKFFIIRGIAENDNFEITKETTIQRIRGVKPISDFRVKRMDNAEVKRVELHAHTQMSDMDGVIPADVLVKKAFEWGHRGIAITDQDHLRL